MVLGCITTALSFFLKVNSLSPSIFLLLCNACQPINFKNLPSQVYDLAADAVPILAVTGILVIISSALSLSGFVQLAAATTTISFSVLFFSMRSYT